ncbi:MAG: NCS2 family permease [Myxococcota bacterium]
MKRRTEILAGITNFFTVSYILAVNPAILANDATGMPFSGVATATVLVCFANTLLMGVYARLPFTVAPGMGINAFFAYTVVAGAGVAWPVALGIVFWAGVLFVVVSVTPIRVAIAKAIPGHLRVAIAGGIGIFLAFIGLRNAGLVVSDPVTFVRMGRIDTQVLFSLLGLLVMAFLWVRKKSYAFIVGITLVTALAVGTGSTAPPTRFFSLPDFRSTLLALDIWGALQLALLPTLIAILFTDLFDSISTFIGVAHATGLTDKHGQPIRLKEGLTVDAVATLSAALFGSSSGTAYIESAAGIGVGGRSGLTSVVTALCFLPCLFIAPLVALVPPSATAPVLLIVGAMMVQALFSLKPEGFEELFPVFLTLVLIPLTFSITQGILWGLISHTVLYGIAGRAKEVSKTMLALALSSVSLLLLEHFA